MPDPEETARAALEPGESLVWAGRPDVAPLEWRQFDLKASLLAAPAALVAAILVWNAVAGGFAKLLDYLFVLAALVALCRSEEHTSELQSLMSISYAVFCWKKKNTQH